MIKSINKSKTYVGITKNLNKRIRQHNGEIKGGAKATVSGRPWEYVFVIFGFDDEKTVRQWEWRFHHPFVRRFGVEGRFENLRNMLSSINVVSTATLTKNLVLTFYCKDIYFDRLKESGCKNISSLDKIL